MKELGSDDYRYGKGCIIFRSVCHGSDSFKLYWYREAKRFHCYSCCGNMSLWEMVCFAQGWDIETDFGKAMSFVCRIANIKIKLLIFYQALEQDVLSPFSILYMK